MRKKPLDGSSTFGMSPPLPTTKSSPKFFTNLGVMFRRNLVLVQRDLIQYLGRLVGFLMVNCIFGIVYILARPYTQDQALSKMWVHVWYSGVPSNMAVVAVYALHGELQSILREVRNGMGSVTSYVISKFTLTIPVIFAFAIAALGLPGFVIQDFPGVAFVKMICLWAAYMFTWEASSFAFAALCDDVIIAMLLQITNWFGHFLLGGFLIPEKDVSKRNGNGEGCSTVLIF